MRHSGTAVGPTANDGDPPPTARGSGWGRRRRHTAFSTAGFAGRGTVPAGDVENWFVRANNAAMYSSIRRLLGLGRRVRNRGQHRHRFTHRRSPPRPSARSLRGPADGFMTRVTSLGRSCARGPSEPGPLSTDDRAMMHTLIPNSAADVRAFRTTGNAAQFATERRVCTGTRRWQIPSTQP